MNVSSPDSIRFSVSWSANLCHEGSGNAASSEVSEDHKSSMARNLSVVVILAMGRSSGMDWIMVKIGAASSVLLFILFNMLLCNLRKVFNRGWRG